LEAWQQRWSDYYEELGVSPNASPAVIAAAYRAMAKDFHPDKNPSEAERMVRINDAFEVLSDPARRQRYDQAHQVFRAYKAHEPTASPEAAVPSAQAQRAKSTPSATSVPRAKLKWSERWWVWVGAVIVGLAIIGAIDDHYSANESYNAPATGTSSVSWKVFTAVHPEGTYKITVPSVWQKETVFLEAGGTADLYYNYYCRLDCYDMVLNNQLPLGGLAVTIYPDQSTSNLGFTNVNYHVGRQKYKAYLFPANDTHTMLVYYIANGQGWFVNITADTGTNISNTIPYTLIQLIMSSITHT
jgi:hypothetical protein